VAVTVGDLLEGLRSLSQSLADTSRAESPQRDPGEVLAHWPALASATIRALDLSPLPGQWKDDNASLRALLSRVAAGDAQPPGQPPELGAADAASVLGSMALRVGAVADMLADQPTALTPRDESSALVLLAGVLEPVHRAARSTLELLGSPHDSSAAWLLQRITTHSEALARLGSIVRGGRYADLIAIPPEEDSLDAALATWRTVSQQVLSSPRCVTGLSLQTVAGDLMILTAATVHAVHTAETLGLVPSEPDGWTRKALTDANTRWRNLARWPTFVRLDGVRTLEQEDASRSLRQHVTRLLRDGRDWATPDVIATRTDPTWLLSTMRRAIHTGTAVAAGHERALVNLVHNGGQLWIAALALEPPQQHGNYVYQAHHRRRWVTMPAGDAHGLELLQHAQSATRHTERAGTFLDYRTPLARSLSSGSRSTAVLPGASLVPDGEPQAAGWETVGAAPISAARRRPIHWQSQAPTPPSPSR